MVAAYIAGSIWIKSTPFAAWLSTPFREFAGVSKYRLLRARLRQCRRVEGRRAQFGSNRLALYPPFRLRGKTPPGHADVSFSPLKFRTAGFPECGFKLDCSATIFAHPLLAATLYVTDRPPPHPRGPCCASPGLPPIYVLDGPSPPIRSGSRRGFPI
jgi:hypothetical protein